MIQLVRAQPHHLPDIAANLRPTEAEIFGRLGEDPLAGLQDLLARSPMAGAGILPSGRAGGVWGVMPTTLAGALGGYAWVVLTDMPVKPRHWIARHARVFLDEAQTVYGALRTVMPPGAEADMRWIEWLGFRREPSADVIVGGGRLLGFVREIRNGG